MITTSNNRAYHPKTVIRIIKMECSSKNDDFNRKLDDYIIALFIHRRLLSKMNDFAHIHSSIDDHRSCANWVIHIHTCLQVLIYSCWRNSHLVECRLGLQPHAEANLYKLSLND